MKVNDKKIIFICQITENILKVIKCLWHSRNKIGILGLESETLTADADDDKINESIARLFKKLGFGNNRIIVSVPRAASTCRYLKVPTQIPQEIEDIIYLQGPRFLPYTAAELISGYQVVETDKQGYSDVNFVIVHRDAIERYMKLFASLRTARIIAVLSSYGLSSLYNYIKPREPGPVMVIDVDANQLELAVMSYGKLLFSRAFKISRAMAGWEDFLIDELNKTSDAYLREVGREAPNKIAVFVNGRFSSELAQVLKNKANLAVEELSYAEKIEFPKDLKEKIMASENSFTSLIGLGLEEVDESLVLVPKGMKEKAKGLSLRKEQLKAVYFMLGAIFILGLATLKNFANKAEYIKELKTQLKKIEKDASPLEELENRLKLLEGRLKRKSSGLAILQQIHQVMPEQISLVSLSYEEDKQIILHGQAPERNVVFSFASQLETCEAVKEFIPKVRYATNKKTPSGEIVDFEIACLKEK